MYIYVASFSNRPIHIDKITDVRYATQAELDKRKEANKEPKKPVDKPNPAVQQSQHRQHPDCEDDEEYSPF